jgi:hypothetical protein
MCDPTTFQVRVKYQKSHVESVTKVLLTDSNEVALIPKLQSENLLNGFILLVLKRTKNKIRAVVFQSLVGIAL